MTPGASNQPPTSLFEAWLRWLPRSLHKPFIVLMGLGVVVGFAAATKLLPWSDDQRPPFEDDDDGEEPPQEPEDTVTPVLIQAQPVDGTALLPGQSLGVDLLFDEPLQECRIDGQPARLESESKVARCRLVVPPGSSQWRVSWLATDLAGLTSAGHLTYTVDIRVPDNKDTDPQGGDANGTEATASLLQPPIVVHSSVDGRNDDLVDCYRFRSAESGKYRVTLQNNGRGDFDVLAALTVYAGSTPAASGRDEYTRPGRSEQTPWFSATPGQEFTVRVSLAQQLHGKTIHYRLQVEFQAD